jgi:hypothetical protein
MRYEIWNMSAMYCPPATTLFYAAGGGERSKNYTSCRKLCIASHSRPASLSIYLHKAHRFHIFERDPGSESGMTHNKSSRSAFRESTTYKCIARRVGTPQAGASACQLPFQGRQDRAVYSAATISSTRVSTRRAVIAANPIQGDPEINSG